MEIRSDMRPRGPEDHQSTANAEDGFRKGDFLPITLYEKLNVRENATQEEIEDAFRRGQAVVHPDHCTDPKFADGVAYGKLLRARTILANPRTRERYNFELNAFKNMSAPPKAQNRPQEPVRTTSHQTARTPQQTPATSPRTATMSQPVTPLGPSRRSPTTFGPNDGDVRPDFKAHRLGILVIDGSGSMDENGPNNIKKRFQVDDVVNELVTRLQEQERKLAAAYSLGFIYFNETPIVVPPVEVSRITERNFDPVSHTGGGGTRMDIALTASFEMAKSFLSTPSPYPRAEPSATIIVLGDGLCHAALETAAVAQNIHTTSVTNATGRRRKVSIKAAYFEGMQGDPDAEGARQLMQNISGRNSEFYSTVRNAEDLLRFYLFSLGIPT